MQHVKLCLCGLWLSSMCSTVAASQEAFHSLTGDIFFPRGMPRPETSHIQVVLLLQGGLRQRAFVTSNASFAFQRVPSGLHTVETSCVGYMFPSVRIDVAPAGDLSLTYTEFPEQSLQMPLVIRAARVEYFDTVQRFDLVGFMKSPMGLLAAFMVFAMLLSPYLKVDPEELESYQKEVEEAKAAKAEKALRSAEAARLPPAPSPAGRSQPPRAAGGLTSAKQRNRRS